MEEKRLRRSKDKMLAGVCAGLAEYFNIDPVLMRVAFALMGLFAGFGVPLYVILWIVMPEADAAVPVAAAPAATPPAPEPESGKAKKK
jgi:phage shock protein C